MKRKYDSITITEREDGVILLLPDGSSVEVPQDTIRRSATLQEAIHTEEMGNFVSISLPPGVLQDWLQSVDALKAATATTGHGTGLSHNPRLLKFLKV